MRCCPRAKWLRHFGHGYSATYRLRRKRFSRASARWTAGQPGPHGSPQPGPPWRPGHYLVRSPGAGRRCSRPRMSPLFVAGVTQVVSHPNHRVSANVHGHSSGVPTGPRLHRCLWAIKSLTCPLGDPKRHCHEDNRQARDSFSGLIDDTGRLRRQGVNSLD
jgi:hypothetical protein